MDERQLLKDCLDGNVQAQKRLYEMYARKMFGLCLRYAPDRNTAEDFLQEGFIRVFMKLDSYRFQGSFEGWVRRIMVNTSLEMLRRNDVLKYSVELDNSVSLADEEEVNDKQIEPEMLMNHIQQMPAGFRAVFNLFAIDEYSHREISSILGISEGTSKSQYARARMWLQKHLTKNK
jgi:RNA polymerase sigma factor (sigma-70 family)